MSEQLRHVILDVLAVPWRKDDIFVFFGVQHTNREQTKYGINNHEGHKPALRKFFERIQFYKLRLNPKKCTFGITSIKLLGFMFNQRGIEVNPDKIKAIMEIKPPRTEKEI
nr:uncharacterized protein K02A2.6-like [Quercus suber]XP_023924568.1 uncharacterized protein K02A2.6-like [Quercus suber]